MSKKKFLISNFKNYRKDFSKIRSSHPKVFCKKGMAKFTGKHLRPATLLKKRLWNSCFSVNFEIFVRATFS